uniref:Myb/SANT-like domain-containing protein n=1 Tax=Lactuca sativa TaxID=4236 RepID=A0A9R1UN36_LACSA|nr:hypothetical protein LSAT_V11C800448160 [Lactuca sativa]
MVPWTSNEETKLVEELVNMTNAGGFKADNGFKSGYLQHLEQALKQSLSNSGLLNKPHIESKIKTMKKYWQCVYDMVNDRAQGNRARDFMEMEQEVNLEEETQDSDDDFLDLEEVSRTTVVQHDETSPSVRSKKRKNRSDEGFNKSAGLVTESLKKISKDLS